MGGEFAPRIDEKPAELALRLRDATLDGRLHWRFQSEASGVELDLAGFKVIVQPPGWTKRCKCVPPCIPEGAPRMELRSEDAPVYQWPRSNGAPYLPLMRELLEVAERSAASGERVLDAMLDNLKADYVETIEECNG